MALALRFRIALAILLIFAGGVQVMFLLRTSNNNKLDTPTPTTSVMGGSNTNNDIGAVIDETSVGIRGNGAAVTVRGVDTASHTASTKKRKLSPPSSSSSSSSSSNCDDWEGCEEEPLLETASKKKESSSSSTKNDLQAWGGGGSGGGDDEEASTSSTIIKAASILTQTEEELEGQQQTQPPPQSKKNKKNKNKKKTPAVAVPDEEKVVLQELTKVVPPSTAKPEDKQQQQQQQQQQQKKKKNPSPPGSTISKLQQQPQQPHAQRDFFSENRAHGAAERAAIDSTSMTSYVSTGGRFPILIVTCDRAEMLKRTLEALQKVRGVLLEDIFVIQDGSVQAVTDVLVASGVKYHQKTAGMLIGGGMRGAGGRPDDGAERIATHYGYSLNHMFTREFPNAPAVVVVEDDFLFAPDFYEYFHAVAPAIEADPTLWLASAWNDNGFDYLVADPYGLRRTRYFPGLGWLLPRRLFLDELKPIWPYSHWDHWLRDPAQHKGRDIIYPEIPRDYHAGVKGTFMDGNTHNRYFGSIAMQTDPQFTWDTPVGAAAIEDVVITRYDARLRRVVSNPDTVHLASVEAINAFKDGVGIVWYSCPPNEQNHDKMRAVAGYFGVWHEGARGSRDGVHEIWWLGTSKLYLVNAFDMNSGGGLLYGGGAGVVHSSTIPSSLRSLMPKGTRVIDWSEFLSASRPQIPTHGDLFGAITLSPLSHLEGGPDANGAPDTNGNAGGGGGGIVVYTRESGWDHEEDVAEDHSHSHFMNDLRLTPAASGVVGGTSNAGTGSSNNNNNNAVSHRIGVLPESVVVVPSKKMGASCTEVCNSFQQQEKEGQEKEEVGGGEEVTRWICAATYLPVLNDCSSLRAAFPCSSCGDSIGSDQPAMVDMSAPGEKGPGSCLVNGDPALFSCDGSWGFARRLCPCEMLE